MTGPARAAACAAACGLLAGLTLISACAGHRPPPGTAPVPFDSDDGIYLRSHALMVPVVGVRPDQVPDTYHTPRSGGREHRALDILAPRGTPVISADDGRVLRMRTNSAGGLTIYAVDAGNRFVYYYAHLDRYASTLSEGKDVVKGEVIGYVGTTGNAPANVPHLHFQLMKRPNAARWWDGEPIDPKPFLAIAGVARQ